MSECNIKIINLLGKDYFTVIEAAFYAGVSTRQFERHHKKLGIRSFKFMGKKLFRRDEIQASIESERENSLKV